MKTNVTLIGYPLSFEKTVDLDVIPDVGEAIRVSSPYGTRIVNGYVTRREFGEGECSLEVQQA
jgi:hypothetical protein